MTLSTDAAPSIATLLRRRGAWLDGDGVALKDAERRARVSRAIAEAFPAFELLRDRILRGREIGGSPSQTVLLATLRSAGLVDGDARVEATSAEARRYLSGGWLEEYAGLALAAAGADEIRIGQCVRWIARGYEGVNEIDAIGRFDTRLVFVSAKALRARLDVGDAAHRERLMDALAEADNLVDHFGDPRSGVALLVTTDLFDEAAREPRYEQLHGKAAALGVELVPLEGLDWTRLVRRFETLGVRRAETGR